MQPISQKICKYNVFSPKICKYVVFSPEIRKYGIFVAKICKNALIDSFEGFAVVIDNSASYAGLPVEDTCRAVDIISSQTAGEAGPVVGPVLLHPGLVLLLGEVAGVEDAGEPVESHNGEAQMGIFDSAHQVEADQLALEHKITVQRIARTLHICNITRIVMAMVNSTPAR